MRKSPTWKAARREVIAAAGTSSSSAAAASLAAAAPGRPVAIRSKPPPAPPTEPVRGPTLCMNWSQFWTYHVLLGEDDFAEITRRWLRAANRVVDCKNGPNSVDQVQSVEVATSAQHVGLTREGVFVRGKRLDVEVPLQWQ